MSAKPLGAKTYDEMWKEFRDKFTSPYNSEADLLVIHRKWKKIASQL